MRKHTARTWQAGLAAGSLHYEQRFGRPHGWAATKTSLGVIYTRGPLRVLATITDAGEGDELGVSVSRLDVEGASPGAAAIAIVREAFVPEGVDVEVDAAAAWFGASSVYMGGRLPANDDAGAANDAVDA